MVKRNTDGTLLVGEIFEDVIEEVADEVVEAEEVTEDPVEETENAPAKKPATVKKSKGGRPKKK